MARRYDYARRRGIRDPLAGILTPAQLRRNDELGREAEIWLADRYGLERPKLLGGDGGRDWILPAYGGSFGFDVGGLFALVKTQKGTAAGRWASAALDADRIGDGYRRVRLDIKGTESASLPLLVKGKLRADAYALVRKDALGWSEIGFAWRHMLQGPKATRQGPRWYAELADLHPIRMLMAAHGLTIRE